MYKIFCDGKPLYDPRDEELQVLSAKIKLAVNSTGELIFSLAPTHAGIGSIKKLVSVVELYDDKELLYNGRVILSKMDMYGSVTYTCEGELSYLLDSIQRPREYHDLTPRLYLEDKLAQHNSQVEPNKQFVLGIVEKQVMNYDARSDNQYTNTLETIMDKLIKSNGGYLRTRKENGIRYLDYLESYGRTSLQTIRFGENILDLTEHINAGDIITVLIPLGKAPEGSADGEKLTIASVNNGKDYLESQEAINLYGRITGTKEWQDVTVPENLKAKGQEYLESVRNLAMTIELTAVDLHLVDVDIDRIKLGDMVRVASPPHGLDRYMMVSKREYDLLDPSADKIVLGDSISALTEKHAELQKEINKQQSMKEEVQSLGVSISKVAGAVSDVDEKVQVMETLYSPLPEHLQQIQDDLKEMADRHDLDEKELSDTLSEISDRLDVLEKGGTN